MKLPNFFIVGAPKCATTALYKYLQTHPNIFMPEGKEPCFFCTDFPNERDVKTMDEYLKLFADTKDEHLVIGEASVWYLYSEVAIKSLHEFNPDAKLIVMLRNPVEQVYSMHMQCYIEEYDNETDFIKAWRLQESRKNGENLPSRCKVEQFLQYKAVASYGFQIERLLSIYPREQVKFILFDDIKSNPRQVYQEVMDFLELENDNRQEFQTENASHQYKYKWLGEFMLNQPPWLESVKKWVKRIFRIKKLTAVSSLISKYNIEEGKRDPLPPEFVAELKEEFKEDIARVSELINRDLRHWSA